MEKTDVNALAARMIAAVKEHVAAAVAGLVVRLEDFDARLQAIPAGPRGERGEAGEKGLQGERGEAGAPGERGARGEAGERGAEGPQGLQGALGERGEPGIKGDAGSVGERGEPGPVADLGPLRAQMIEEVGRRVAAIADEMPDPKDGRDGRDGIDGKDGANGEPGRDAAELDILPSIDEAKGYRRGTWASHNGGLIRAARATDPVKDGALLEAGWVVMVEGLACPPVFTQGDDPREITCAVMLTSGVKAATDFRIPAMVYREVWREGEYEQGDVVTWDGSAWHCKQKTAARPGGGSPDWRLMVKHGAAGKDGASNPPSAAAAPVKLR